MEQREQSRVWKFNNDIDTDQIIASQYLLLSSIEEMKKFTFESIYKDFSSDVIEGDVIAAGENFGCGSSREQAPRVLKELGIKAIVAKSFARIFFRNSINIGLPVIICEKLYENINDKDLIEIDFTNGIVKKDDLEFKCTKLPGHMQTILNSDGLIEYLNRKAD
jgi:3-isopropylmalate dehydratase small subunit